ncbi:MAG: 1-deoxy-D-xylulose-5-phosphate reductoisomerase, partial [Phycisphaeraceae bacterium]|nr:1-deoxy-D-xylulose-5-phosphate reductoisomerase [Phycisphaeraceae bacterium]
MNTLRVIDHLDANERPMTVAGLAAGRSVEALAEQARAHDCPPLALADEAAADQLREKLPDATVYSGPDAALELVEATEATDVVAAVVGSAGLPATLAGIKRGLRIGLANKETLVAAGALVTPLVREHDAVLLPIDSEHSAIFQCLADQPQRAIKRIVLTASGGPFRTATAEQMANATVDEALNHPTWDMGPKITIDSATMMNKALEIIEAHWLFDLPGDQIEVIIHPQSIAHSFVEFTDHSVLAQLGPPDMKTPIQYALTYPDRDAGCSEAMDWSALRQLDFEPPDPERFPALRLAFEVIEAGGTAGAVFNAANEAAVAAFLDRKIK